MKFLSVLMGILTVTYCAPNYDNKQSYTKPDRPAVPYNFAWAVKDDFNYNDYGHQEASDSNAKSGTYYVQLPDGRFQTVSYKAGEFGYTAEVSYKGQANYDNNLKPYHSS